MTSNIGSDMIMKMRKTGDFGFADGKKNPSTKKKN